MPDAKKVTKTKTEDPCPICIAVKMTERAHPGANKPEIYLPGQRINCDLHDHKTKSCKGHHYTFTVSDTTSAKLLGNMITRKSDVATAIQPIMERNEVVTRNKCLKVVCDNAPEFIGANCAFRKFMENKGAKIVPSTPHTPNENAEAENANRH